MRIKALSLALAAVVAVGCSEQPAAPTASDDGAVAPTFTIDNAPVESGIVMRGETSVAVGWTDQKDGTFVFIGIDPRDFCNGVFDVDIVPFQEIYHTHGGTLGHIQGQGLRTTVWPFPGFTGCHLLDTYAPLATGVSDLVNTDNMYSGGSPANANAFGFRAHGTLTLASGADAAFSAHVNYRINGNNGFMANSQISLH